MSDLRSEPVTMVDVSPGHCPHCGAEVDVVLILEEFQWLTDPVRVTCAGRNDAPHELHVLHICADAGPRKKCLRDILLSIPKDPALPRFSRPREFERSAPDARRD